MDGLRASFALAMMGAALLVVALFVGLIVYDTRREGSVWARRLAYLAAACVAPLFLRLLCAAIFL